jgi:glucose-6-phosphate 1-dehydrogenase
VLVELKAPPCAAFGEKMEHPNYVRFRLGPDVAIALGVRSKAPGEAMVGQEVELLATRGIGVEMAAYERLLGDAMRGDPPCSLARTPSKRSGASSMRS